MPSDKSEAIRVEGLDEFRKALKAINLEKDLAKTNKEAAEMVAVRARSRAEGLGSVAAKTAPSIKAAAQQRSAVISLGGGQYPFAMGAEFGGGSRPTTHQFEPWRGHTGYFLYPTIRKTRDQFLEIYDRALQQLFHAAFPD